MSGYDLIGYDVTKKTPTPFDEESEEDAHKVVALQ